MTLADELPPGAFEHTVALALKGHQALLARLDELGDDPLRAFLDHVQRTVPYHRGRGDQLADYPVVDRTLVRERRAEFLSDSHAGDVERLWARTNGTLSTPLVVGFDVASDYELYQFLHARMAVSRPGLREALVSGEVGIHYVSDIPEDPRLTAYLAALGGVLLRRLQFGRGPEQDVASVETLRAGTTILYGKPHTLLRVAELDRRTGGGRIRPRIIGVSGASLYPDVRAHLEAWFGCSIINAYVATESGPIAIDCEHGTGMHVLADRVVVEVLQPDGRLVDEGTGEVVVTNVMNWAHPFVRYRLGDVATVRSLACPCGHDGPTIVELPGREVASYQVTGVGQVEAATLEPILLRPEVKQFEVAEPEPGRLLIRWIAADGIDAEATERTLAGQLGAVLSDGYELCRVLRITIDGGKALRFVRTPRFP